MTALCVDDEIILLNMLKRAVTRSGCADEAIGFTDEIEALEWARENTFDIAFLDVELHVMDGLEVAEKLKELRPDCLIVFCTGYSNYAVDAVNRDVGDAYLLKPIRAEIIRETVEKLLSRGNSQKKNAALTVSFANGISAFDRTGKLIVFKRNKTPALLSILVNGDGGNISTPEICKALWNDNDVAFQENKKYLNQLVYDLRRSLEQAGITDILQKTVDGYALDMSDVRVVR